MAAAQPGSAQRLTTLWQGLQERERWLVGLAFIMIVGAAVWFTAIRPAWVQLQQTPAKLDELDSQILVMRRLATETRELAKAPRVNSSDAQAALKAATARLGNQAKLNLRVDRAVLTVEGISADALRAWLSEVRSGARAQAVEAQLMNTNSSLSGTITLSLASAP